MIQKFLLRITPANRETRVPTPIHRQNHGSTAFKTPRTSPREENGHHASPTVGAPPYDDLIAAYAHHVWDKYNTESLDHICHSFTDYPLGHFNGLGAPCPVTSDISADIVTTAVDTKNQPLLDILLGLDASGYPNTHINVQVFPVYRKTGSTGPPRFETFWIPLRLPRSVKLEYLLQTCSTDPCSIVRILSLYTRAFNITYTTATLVALALKGWHATVRLLHPKATTVTMMERNDHLQIWLAAVRDRNRASIDYFTKSRPTSCCYGLLTRAMELRSVTAVKCLLDIPAKENGIAENAGTLLKLARKHQSKMIVFFLRQAIEAKPMHHLSTPDIGQGSVARINDATKEMKMTSMYKIVL
ncbi:hypothetical protein HK097_003721 [Rhizophlyctis rosea]|uniref:Uncharacterized protein n=1 Tax=Rhizophlyctis rosea TaxID=64517 RepID=A0AAD5X685_9FUNG|nr:hypothetical protein HK097_003721 [Rhizophlyctis rosea]